MNDTNIPALPPTLGLKDIALLLRHLGRWALLREMCRGEALPRSELARRTGQTLAVTSRHLGLMRRMGVVVVGYGSLHSLAPAYRPAPGTATIDFGHCVVRLDMPAP